MNLLTIFRQQTKNASMFWLLVLGIFHLYIALVADFASAAKLDPASSVVSTSRLLSTSHSDMVSDCDLPFAKMTDIRTNQAFVHNDVINQRQGLASIYQSRYLVLNLNSVGEDGLCKGVQENYPDENARPIHIFPELSSSVGLKSYLQSVIPYYTKPGNIHRVGLHVTKIACIGQSVSLCEIREGRTFKVATLVTSSVDRDAGFPAKDYYSAYSFINTRSWAENRSSYTALDALRDTETGGVKLEEYSGREVLSYFEGRWVMPNFMNVVAMPGYKSNPANGFHELSGGETNDNTLGAPVSQGCFRLTKYGSILLRWWTPLEARVFIYYTPEGYKKWATLNGRPYVF